MLCTSIQDWFFCLNLMATLCLGENCVYLFISPKSYLVEVEGGVWVKMASHSIFSHGQGRREKTRTEQQDTYSVSNASLGSVLTCLSIGFLSSLYRSWCFALHWRRAAASSAPCALSGAFDDGLNRNSEWNLSIRKGTSCLNIRKNYELVTESGALSFYMVNYQTWHSAEELDPSGSVDEKAYFDVLIDVISGQTELCYCLQYTLEKMTV